MAHGPFFVSWELWQQMTFVLAMGIAFVLLVGLMKLWCMNRHMKKIEELDAEKQVRAAQTHRSGLSASRRSRLRSEIPFGVKALESGVEVDGVWVARMASLASRPPERKWSSKRKIKTPVLDIDDASSSRRSGRGSARAGRITRREIIKPSIQTGRKLENLQLAEGEPPASDCAANYRLPTIHTDRDREDVRSPTQEDRGGHSGHTGPLGRIQRSLKKMTSLESWNEKQKKQLGGQEAIEFRINSQARKPRRFYPQTATPTVPERGIPGHQPIPQRRSSLHSNSDRSPAETATSGPTEVSGTRTTRQLTSAPRNQERRHQTSRASSTSSAESFATSIEELKEFASRPRPPPIEHHPVFSSSGDVSQGAPEEVGLTFGRRRSSRRSRRSSSSRNGHARQSSSEDRSTIHDHQQQHDAASQSGAPATALRYPPNSSRSAAYIQQPRPQSFTPEQQQPRPDGGGAGSSSAAQPSPTFGPSDSYINTSTRKVNSNFEVLPAGTFGLPEQQHAAQEPASTAASVRSSFESQRSGRRKLQKKRASCSCSK